MIRLLAVDIDGTLLDSAGQVPPANVAALDRVAAAGVEVVVATGRSFHFALQALGALPGSLTLIVHNGAIARTREGHTLFRRLLPRAAAREVLGATLPWRSEVTAIFDRPLGGQMIYDRMDWTHPNRWRFKERNHEVMQEVPHLEDAVTEDPVQLAYNGSCEAMRAVVAHLEGLPVAAALEISRTEYPHRDFAMVDVCGAGTTKGSGLAALAALRGLSRGQVMAVGDNHNDLSMLAWAGTGVVMGNAQPALHAAGLPVTGSNDDAGLAQAIDRFIPGA